MGSLIRLAQEEGSLTLIALPQDWCNSGGLIAGVTGAYGVDVSGVNPCAGGGSFHDLCPAGASCPKLHTAARYGREGDWAAPSNCT
jgi:hypothetical protein